MRKFLFTISLLVSVFAQAQISASFTAVPVCENSQMTLVSTSDADGDTLDFFQWDLDNDGDFDDATGEIVKHIFSGVGSFTVGLRVISNDPDTSFVYSGVLVNPLPVANFLWNEVCVGESMAITDNSNGNGSLIESRIWIVDNVIEPDSSLVQFNPVFDTSGFHDVSLRVITNVGCEAIIDKQVFVNVLPTADFSVGVACLGDTTNFTSMSSISNGVISAYQWDLNSDKIYGDQVGVQVGNVFLGTGQWTIGLRAISDKGCAHDTIKSVTVNPVPQALFSTNDVCYGDSSQYQNLSNVTIGTLTSTWFFTPTDSIVAFEPKFLFADTGSYSVELKVSNMFGCSDDYTRNLVVNPAPVAQFTASEACLGSETAFEDQSSINGTLVNRFWEFNDGEGSVSETPNYGFETSDTFSVSLLIENDLGCIDQVFQDVIVRPLPNVQIWAADKEFCDGDNIQLDAITDASNLLWSTGESSSSISVSESGEIILVGFNEYSCSSRDSINVTKHDNPTFTVVGSRTISLGQSTALAVPDNYVYSWESGLGHISSGIEFTEALESTTDVTVTATNEYNCTTAITVEVVVERNYDITPDNLFTPNGDGKNDTWFIENISSYDDCEVYVFNRWGTEVYMSNIYQNNWNGKDKGGNDLPDGGYYYVIKCGGMDKDLTGPVSILRLK